MQHDAFIGHVQDRARLGSRGDAERLVRAALETLGERVPQGLAENQATSGSVVNKLRESLPDDLASVAAAGSGDRLDDRGGAGGRS